MAARRLVWIKRTHPMRVKWRDIPKDMRERWREVLRMPFMGRVIGISKMPIVAAITMAIIPAIIGGFVGSWYGGYLARERWKYERTLDAYTSLLNVLDEAIFLSAKIPADLRFAGDLKKAGKESEAIARAAQMLDAHFPQLASLITKARTSCTIIQVLQSSRQQQAEDWLREFSSQAVAMESLSIQAVGGDTSAHRAAQGKLESLRRGIVQAEREDFGIE